MTQAVCFRCGDIKFGSFCPCGKCQALPETDEELALSLAMSDHYFSLADLRLMGDRIRSGQPIDLNPEQKAEMVAMIRDMRQDPQFADVQRRMRAENARESAAIAKPWWKFW